MSFNLNDVFEEAKADPLSVSINALEFEAQLLCGIKIIRDRRKLLKTSRVTILNTQRGEIQPNDYEMFKTFGWKHGVYVLSLSNCCLKIDRLEQSIVNEELREQPREKQIKSTRIQIQKSHNRKLLLIEKFNKFKINQL